MLPESVVECLEIQLPGLDQAEIRKLTRSIERARRACGEGYEWMLERLKTLSKTTVDADFLNIRKIVISDRSEYKFDKKALTRAAGILAKEWAELSPFIGAPSHYSWSNLIRCDDHAANNFCDYLGPPGNVLCDKSAEGNRNRAESIYALFQEAKDRDLAFFEDLLEWVSRRLRKPFWDEDCTLWYDNELARTVPKNATVVRRLLLAFQANDWEPLDVREHELEGEIGDYVRRLNGGKKDNRSIKMIEFYAVRNSKHIAWRPT